MTSSTVDVINLFTLNLSVLKIPFSVNFDWYQYFATQIHIAEDEIYLFSSILTADVGGFFNNPDSELLARWYQVPWH